MGILRQDYLDGCFIDPKQQILNLESDIDRITNLIEYDKHNPSFVACLHDDRVKLLHRLNRLKNGLI